WKPGVWEAWSLFRFLHECLIEREQFRAHALLAIEPFESVRDDRKGFRTELHFSRRHRRRDISPSIGDLPVMLLRRHPEFRMLLFGEAQGFAQFADAP